MGVWTRQLVVLAAALCAAGCTTSRSTRNTADDFQAVAAEMAASLSRCEAIADRTPDSPPWTISLNKVENLSMDVMTESEQWSIMADLFGSLPLQTLWRDHNIRFVMPAERVAAMRDADEFAGDGFAGERRVTHTMTAQLMSLTRAVKQERTDSYYWQFEIIDLTTGRSIWQDRFEYKRSARGIIWD